jgi:hypothetical protein
MKNYINQVTKEIYAYESDGSQDAYIKEGLVPISDADLAILRAPALPEAKATKITQLTQAYNTAIQQPVSYMSTTFQADAGSVTNVQATLAGLSKAGATPTGFYWVSADNTQVPFSYADIQGLAAAMLSQGWSAFAHLQAQKAIVNASSTVSAVQGVVW